MDQQELKMQKFALKWLRSTTRTGSGSTFGAKILVSIVVFKNKNKTETKAITITSPRVASRVTPDLPSRHDSASF